METMKTINNIKMLSALKSADSIYMCTHISPDGDAIGSLLATGRIMEQMGKRVVMCCQDPVPQKYLFLSGAHRICTPEQCEGMTFDLAFALDCADERRMGASAEAYRRTAVQIQLDHHDTNPEYAQINEVDGHASSTGCMVWRLARALEVSVDRETAACIYTAISTDTGNFSFANCDAETFACAAAMVDTGFDLNHVSRKVHLLREEAHVRLLGRALNSLRYFANGACTCMLLTKEDYEAAGAASEHCDGIINYALNLPGVCMAYLADTHGEKAKISFRAVAPYRVSDIAGKLGGGGHVLAAGCRIDGDVNAACKLIEMEMEKQIGEQE